jgi:hypothetical protein
MDKMKIVRCEITTNKLRHVKSFKVYSLAVHGFPVIVNERND